MAIENQIVAASIYLKYLGVLP